MHVQSLLASLEVYTSSENCLTAVNCTVVHSVMFVRLQLFVFFFLYHEL
jgi:hypothetical protein